MRFLYDLHLHTRRHSRCSTIDEFALIDAACRKGLHGIVITEHHYQWSQDELAELAARAGVGEDFTLLAAFEYSSAGGDLLVYGLEPAQVDEFRPGGDPERMLAKAQAMGAVCVAAHPTRAAIPFDERIRRMPFDALEVQSVNLRPEEQARAKALAERMSLPQTASSDAHRLADVGAYATAFDVQIRCMADLQDCLKRGKFRPAGRLAA